MLRNHAFLFFVGCPGEVTRLHSFPRCFTVTVCLYLFIQIVAPPSQFKDILFALCEIDLFTIHLQLHLLLLQKNIKYCNRSYRPPDVGLLRPIVLKLLSVRHTAKFSSGVNGFYSIYLSFTSFPRSVIALLFEKR